MTALDGVLQLALSQGSVVSLSAGLGEDCFTPAQVAGSVTMVSRGPGSPTGGRAHGSHQKAGTLALCAWLPSARNLR